MAKNKKEDKKSDKKKNHKQYENANNKAGSIDLFSRIMNATVDKSGGTIW